jgi:hypothetical protein
MQWRIALVEQLTRDAWALSGRPLPEYERSTMPGGSCGAVAELPGLNEDFRDILAAFHAEAVDYVVVGAHALAAHGVVRATGDLDLLVRPTADNAVRVAAALRSFGAPLAAHGVVPEDFARPAVCYQIGLPPRRIDVLTEASGVDFDAASEGAVEVVVDGLPVRVMGRRAIVVNKRASGRPKDLEDLRLLGEVE